MNITNSVGKNGCNKKNDVKTIQALLNRNIDLIPPITRLITDGECGKRTIRAIRTYQEKIVGIAPSTGLVAPRSKTLRILNKKAIVVLRGSVGRNSLNHKMDVKNIQRLLNRFIAKLSPLKRLIQDGIIGSKTIAAIKKFQRRIVLMTRPDGKVSKSGRTIKALNARNVESQEKTSETIQFPLKIKPAQSYKTGIRRFGANRSEGRKHAGCDLYADAGTPIFAMSSGIVRRGPYNFYRGTKAIEIDHGDYLARYCEISNAAKGIQPGTKIRKGKTIGYVGQISGLKYSMLHLEIYSGKSKGRLTVRSNLPYQRRADLMNPKQYLDRANV